MVIESNKGMTKEEICDKLIYFNHTISKFEYLNYLEEKADLFKPNTRKAFYETLGDLASKLYPTWEGILEYYQKAGVRKKLRKTLLRFAEESFKRGEFRDASKHYSNLGMKEKAEKYLKMPYQHELESLINDVYSTERFSPKYAMVKRRKINHLRKKCFESKEKSEWTHEDILQGEDFLERAGIN